MSGPALSEFVVVNLTLSTGPLVDSFDFGATLGAFDHSVTANRVDGPYADLDAVVDAGFTAAAEPEVHAWASSVFGQSPHVSSVKIGRIDAGDLDATATITAIAAADPDFYLLNYESRLDEDILDIAAWAETQGGDTPKLYIAQTADKDMGGSEPVLETLQAASYHRTAGIYHRHSTSSDGSVTTDGYLDGAWTSRCGAFRLDDAGGRGAWAFKNLAGVTADPMTAAEAAAIFAANGNVYGSTKSVSFASKGTVASGRYIDVTTSLDWGRIRLGEAMLQEFVDEPNVIPYTAAGINRMAAVGQRVLELGVRNGHFSPDHERKIVKPRIQDVALADKVVRALTCTGEVTLAGGIQKATFNIVVHQ